jgi:hypothetical protein
MICFNIAHLPVGEGADSACRSHAQKRYSLGYVLGKADQKNHYGNHNRAATDAQDSAKSSGSKPDEQTNDYCCCQRRHLQEKPKTSFV